MRYVGISRENQSIQASMVMLDTVAKGHSLIITDAPARVEAVAY